MFVSTFTGHVKSIELTESPGSNGEPSKIASLTFVVSHKKYNKETKKSEYTNYYCNCRAWDKVAEIWSNYQPNQVIEGIGRFVPSPYVNKETGEPQVSFNVYGIDGATPHIEWVPREWEEKPQPSFGSGKTAKPRKGNELEIQNDDDWS